MPLQAAAKAGQKNVGRRGGLGMGTGSVLWQGSLPGFTQAGQLRAFPCHSPAAGDSPCDGTEERALHGAEHSLLSALLSNGGCGLWGLDGGREALGLSGATAESGLLGLHKISPFISLASSKIRLNCTVPQLGRENKEDQARPPRTCDNSRLGLSCKNYKILSRK